MQSADRTDSTRGRVFILPLCSWKIIRSGAGNHSEMDLKTIALDSVPAVAELKELNRGTNDRLCEESAATDTGKEHWTGTGATADSLATGRTGMELLENRSLSEFKMGDDGDRLINGREAAVNQGWRIVIPAPGPGTNSRRINVEYPISNSPNLRQRKRSCSRSRKRSGMRSRKDSLRSRNRSGRNSVN